MAPASGRRASGRAHGPSLRAVLIGLALGLVVGAGVSWFWPGSGLWPLVAGLGTAGLLVLIAAASTGRPPVRPRWSLDLAHLAEQVRAWTTDPARPLELPELADLEPLAQALESLRRKLTAMPRFQSERSMTRSGLYEVPIPIEPAATELTSSRDFTTLDMVSRLEPKTLRWLDSSQAEQEFLGWKLSELRNRSFIDVVHPDDRSLAWEQLQGSLVKGEAHGLVYRIKTARGEPKAIEMNVSVRYGPDMKITHLRCHVTDVTAKVRAGRELRRRTKELTRVNQELRKTNRELQELQERLSDLYQNAPIMYFSLDEAGYILECNNTLLRTLGYQRPELIGRPYTILLPESRMPAFATNFAEFRRTGYIEVESRWKKANGELIDVWVTGTAVRDAEGKVRHSRSVAQDVTQRRALEAELKEKNERLASANAELQRRNKELDEFTYVVSHDLQEPVRTLIAFSDFLLKDYGDRLDDEGREYVHHLVEASRRMRSLIYDVLSLSRAGRVTGEFDRVSLDDVLAQVQADLAELIRSRNAAIRVVAPLPALWGDRDRIVQLLSNLVANGIKYNQNERPTIEVGTVAGDDPAWATLYVRDNGIGIDPEYHAKIFQIFRRLHTREEYEGTGAGLAICQKIVQAHGGQIWVDSELGRGARFFVKLRRQPEESSLLQAEVLHAP